MRLFFLIVLLSLLLVSGYAWLAGHGFWGQRQSVGEIVTVPRNGDFVQDKLNRQRQAEQQFEPGGGSHSAKKQILFGDLHVHTTYSFDAYTISLPMYDGEGSHPPADACDFARYCSGLDFWSINDHAEGLTPAQWRNIKNSVRQCNDAAGDPENPDMVTFLGWEWTQIGDTAEQHYGHKNVVLRDTAEDRVPARPISSREQLFPGGANPFGLPMRLLLLATGGGDKGRQPYHDFNRFLQDRDELVSCPAGKAVRDLPVDCQESALTPGELFGKLDDWAFPYMVIPHGNTWGIYTPTLTSWDKQLVSHTDPERHEYLIEVFSGHGNIEQYRPWRARAVDANGEVYCPGPSEDYLPECWQAGEIIRQRCSAAGESEAECESRAQATRANFILSKDSGHWTVPGRTLEDWLDAGQCRDCYLPAYDYRPGGSVQYGLAIRDFSAADGEPKRFRWGMLASSDVHTARPGTGYKEIMRRNMSDAALGQIGPPPQLTQREAEPRPITLEQAGGDFGAYFERFASFFGTGGLVAVHSAGRDRGAIWDALQNKEVYGTSGDRILLWFDLIETGGEGRRRPMGSSLQQQDTPRFEVSAMGAFEQKPGCPADAVNSVDGDRLQRLCGGECYHPADRRKRIDRIEVVRIQPQNTADEDVTQLIEDPWQVLPCPAGSQGCRVEFSDAEFESDRRDTVYYVRAIQQASPTINGDQLRCSRDESGRCIDVNPCRAALPTTMEDDCLAMAEERAWSSPIFVDFDTATSNQ